MRLTIVTELSFEDELQRCARLKLFRIADYVYTLREETIIWMEKQRQTLKSVQVDKSKTQKYLPKKCEAYFPKHSSRPRGIKVMLGKGNTENYLAAKVYGKTGGLNIKE